MKTLLRWKPLTKIFVFLVVLVFPIASFAAGKNLSTLQKKELTFFGLKAFGLASDISAVKKNLPLPDIEKLVATGINLNGHLCARIVEIRPLKVKSTYEIACIAYRGGKAQKLYIIDALKGVAFTP